MTLLDLVKEKLKSMNNVKVLNFRYCCDYYFVLVAEYYRDNIAYEFDCSVPTMYLDDESCDDWVKFMNGRIKRIDDVIDSQPDYKGLNNDFLPIKKIKAFMDNTQTGMIIGGKIMDERFFYPYYKMTDMTTQEEINRDEIMLMEDHTNLHAVRHK